MSFVQVFTYKIVNDLDFKHMSSYHISMRYFPLRQEPLLSLPQPNNTVVLLP